MGFYKNCDLERQFAETKNKPLDYLMSDEFPKKPFEVIEAIDNFIFNKIIKN